MNEEGEIINVVVEQNQDEDDDDADNQHQQMLDQNEVEMGFEDDYN